MVGESLMKAAKGVTQFEVDGVAVFLRRLSLGDLLRYKASRDATSPQEAASLLVALSLCESGGTPALTDDQVKELPVAVINVLATKIAELNGFDEAAEGEPGKAPSTEGQN